jgi:hypothetical protein
VARRKCQNIGPKGAAQIASLFAQDLGLRHNGLSAGGQKTHRLTFRALLGDSTIIVSS